MKYQSQTSMTGAWVDKSSLTNGTRAKIVSETKPIPSSFQDEKGNIKNQDVAKVQFEGQKEAVNVALNRSTIDGLISAFGDDSLNWMGKYLTVEVEKMRVAGKAVTALYLIPQGYRKVDDAEGYAKIVKDDIPVIEPRTTITEEDLPF